jgi:hypothetical protein
MTRDQAKGELIGRVKIREAEIALEEAVKRYDKAMAEKDTAFVELQEVLDSYLEKINFQETVDEGPNEGNGDENPTPKKKEDA